MTALTLPPWSAPAWQADSEARMDLALRDAGRPRLGTVRTEKAWGRACLQTVDTEAGTLWIKHGYGLPPGEEAVLQRLSRRWPELVPRVVAIWPGALAVEPMPGVELTPEHPVSLWCEAARTLAEIAAGEREHVPDWLDLGVRDRRPATWRGAVDALLASPVLEGLDVGTSKQLRIFVPEFITRYEEAFDSPATLVHQDSGCCNIHVEEEQGSLIHFDWADVVVGHPVFSCDRLLDQAPAENHGAIIDAFRAPLNLSPEEFNAMRRSNVLHEVLRYHDELQHMSTEGPEHASLSKSVCSQLKVLVDHERSRP